MLERLLKDTRDPTVQKGKRRSLRHKRSWLCGLAKDVRWLDVGGEWDFVSSLQGQIWCLILVSKVGTT